MASSSLFDDCKDLIERGHESWKSYFTKWEVFAKYEEDLPENFCLEKSDSSINHTVKKKKKNIPETKKKKTLSLITYKKNQRNKKKVFKKKKIHLKSVVAHKALQHCTNSRKENEDKIYQNDMLETNLKTFFRNFLRENQNKFELFGVLSLAFSGSQESNFHNLFLDHQQALHSYDFLLNKTALSCTNQQTEMIVSNKLVCPVRNTYIDYFKGTINCPEFHANPVPRKLRWINNHALNDRYSRFEFYFKNNLNQPNIDSTPRITTGINLGAKNDSSFLRNPNYGNSKLKPLAWDFGHKSSVGIYRKINKKSLITSTFPKMNITQDGKRFRNLCLHKMTNHVSLSMENSNFTTPKRKPPEQKCFSENVLQRKRRCPSKLFFDNEEDSESDDQIEKQTPLIHSQNKKLKTQKSDSDYYESILDRVRKS